MTSTRAIGGIALILFGLIELIVYINKFTDNFSKVPVITIIMFFVLIVAPIAFGIMILFNFKITQYIKSKALKSGEPSANYKDIEKQLLKLAYSLGGVLTVVDVSLNTDLSLEIAQASLDYMVKRGYVKIKVAQNGTVLYHFPGILTDNEKKAAQTIDELLEEKA